MTLFYYGEMHFQLSKSNKQRKSGYMLGRKSWKQDYNTALQMGCCCTKGLLRQPLEHKTEIYYLCSERIKRKSRLINIQLQDDLCKLYPNKQDIIQTPNILKYQTQVGELLLLKDDSGIVTRESRIRESLEQILEKAANKCYQSIVFNQPNVNYQNKLKLFGDLINSVIQYDLRRDGRKLKRIYIPWDDLPVKVMQEKLQQSLSSLLVLD